MRLGLWVPSRVFGFASRRRARAYDEGRRPIERLDRPVISIGNISVGGTGKTPFVAFLANRLRGMGFTPGVLARGYGPTILPAGEPGGPLNDEGLVLRAMLGEELPQVQHPDRIAGAARLLAEHPEVDVLLLDDGFQHRALARDLDIVLLDPRVPMGAEAHLPLGLMREGPEALARAHIVILTGCDGAAADRLEQTQAEVRRHTDALLLHGHRAPSAITGADGAHEVSWLSGRAVDLACGISNPADFLQTLLGLDAEVGDLHAVGDHRRLEPRVFDRRDKPPLLITRKDAVKLSTLPDGVYVLDIEMRLTEGEDALDELLTSICGGTGSPVGDT